MVITLYNTTDDKRKVNKTLKSVKTINNAILYDDFNLIEPRLKISRGGYAGLFASANYAKIDAFNRYYYIKSYDIDSNFVYLNLHEDVLMSNALAIRQLVCTVSRNESLSNGYLRDGSYQTYAYEQVTCKMFPRSINQDSIILMTVG